MERRYTGSGLPSQTVSRTEVHTVRKVSQTRQPSSGLPKPSGLRAPGAIPRSTGGALQRPQQIARSAPPAQTASIAGGACPQTRTLLQQPRATPQRSGVRTPGSGPCPSGASGLRSSSGGGQLRAPRTSQGAGGGGRQLETSMAARGLRGSSQRLAMQDPRSPANVRTAPCPGARPGSPAPCSPESLNVSRRESGGRTGAALRTPGSGLRPPGSGLRPPGSGLRPPGSGLRPPGSGGLRTPAAGLKTPAAGLRAPAAGLRAPAAGLKAPAAGLRTPAAGLRAPEYAVRPPSPSRSPPRRAQASPLRAPPSLNETPPAIAVPLHDTPPGCTPVTHVPPSPRKGGAARQIEYDEEEMVAVPVANEPGTPPRDIMVPASIVNCPHETIVAIPTLAVPKDYLVREASLGPIIENVKEQLDIKEEEEEENLLYNLKDMQEFRRDFIISGLLRKGDDYGSLEMLERRIQEDKDSHFFDRVTFGSDDDDIDEFIEEMSEDILIVEDEDEERADLVENFMLGGDAEGRPPKQPIKPPVSKLEAKLQEELIDFDTEEDPSEELYRLVKF